MSNRTLVVTALLGAIFCGCAWGLWEFVNLTFGAPPSCDVSNTCHLP